MKTACHVPEGVSFRFRPLLWRIRQVAPLEFLRLHPQRPDLWLQLLEPLADRELLPFSVPELALGFPPA
ncbi:MAG: hypothetical protein ACK43N_21085, partial [Pirellulaceae bacterium]